MRRDYFLLTLIALLTGTIQVQSAEPGSRNCAEAPLVEVALAPQFPELPWKARIRADQWVAVEIDAEGYVLARIIRES